MTVAENFDDHWIEDADGCWIWQRARRGKEAKDGGGYGCLKVGSRGESAHKFSYERAHGPVPKGLQLRHQCHKTLCVNPAHLLLGSNHENAQDRLAADRYGKKLTADVVSQIKLLLKRGWTRTQLASYYAVSWSGIDDIFHGRTWKHI